MSKVGACVNLKLMYPPYKNFVPMEILSDAIADCSCTIDILLLLLDQKSIRVTAPFIEEYPLHCHELSTETLQSNNWSESVDSSYSLSLIAAFFWLAWAASA